MILREKDAYAGAVNSSAGHTDDDSAHHGSEKDELILHETEIVEDDKPWSR